MGPFDYKDVAPTALPEAADIPFATSPMTRVTLGFALEFDLSVLKGCLQLKTSL
jgi:hypothetical protein